MRIVCVGGGPAGLYFAISAKRRDPAQDVTVIERNLPQATYGWGVVYWDNLLDLMFRNDMESARRIRRASHLWQEQEIRLDGRSAYLPGYGYSIQRSALLEILTRRARELGVTVRDGDRFDASTTAGRSLLAEADLVVGSDGANSTVRGAYATEFGTRSAVGGNPYLWAGTPRVFEKFTFSFRHTDAGWLWFHAYPSSSKISTCIVECTEATWRAHGFDQLRNGDGLAALAHIFELDLGGAELISQSRADSPRWLRFSEITNRTWVHGNVALLGDAAHTTHFTIGSGTRLAMIDAVALAQCIYQESTLPSALARYDAERRQALRSTQASARASQAWFEHIDHYLGQGASDFAYSMSGRQGEQPPWRYQKHRAAQLWPVRVGHKQASTVSRLYAAARRGEARGPAAPDPSARPVAAMDRGAGQRDKADVHG
jgi:2-polyprenyl-6-methoxyphenol hydroxylase-like FAD-dependent oxidoreductase